MRLVATQRVAVRFIRKWSLGTTSRPFPLNEHFWTRFSSTRERKVDSAIVCLGVFFLFRALAFACLYPLLPLRLPQRLRLNWERLLFFGSVWIYFEKRKSVLTWRLRGHRATLKGQFLPVSTKIHQISNSRMSRSRLDEISLFLRVKLWVSFTLQPKSTILKSSIAALHHLRLDKLEYCHQARDGSGTAKAGVEQSTFWNIY